MYYIALLVNCVCCFQVIPWNENCEMEVFSSTQNPSEIQALVANVLEVPMNRINVRVKRLGVGLFIT